jgi:hypothetical protein
MILLRNNIVLNVRIQEAEARAIEAERQLAKYQARQSGTGTSRCERRPCSGTEAAAEND